jgi:hypothetical protein
MYINQLHATRRNESIKLWRRKTFDLFIIGVYFFVIIIVNF